MNDTEQAFAARYRKMLMLLPPQKRLRMAADMFADAKKLIEESIRRQKGQLTDVDMKTEIFKRFYACDFSAKEVAAIINHLRLHAPL